MTLSTINILNLRNLQSHHQQKHSPKIQYVRLCSEKFHSNQTHVIDHDHFTGKFRGYAHQSYNLNLKDPTFSNSFIIFLVMILTYLFVKLLIIQRLFQTH